MKATVTDLRFHSKEILNTIYRGEEIIITFRGKPCAKIVPYSDEKKGQTKQDLFGIWKDNKDIDNVNDHARDLRKGRE